MMYDATGRLVITETGSSTIGLNQLTLNVNDIPSGIYSISIKIGDKSSQSKVVVE